MYESCIFRQSKERTANKFSRGDALDPIGWLCLHWTSARLITLAIFSVLFLELDDGTISIINPSRSEITTIVNNLVFSHPHYVSIANGSSYKTFINACYRYFLCCAHNSTVFYFGNLANVSWSICSWRGPCIPELLCYAIEWIKILFYLITLFYVHRLRHYCNNKFLHDCN